MRVACVCAALAFSVATANAQGATYKRVRPFAETFPDLAAARAACTPDALRLCSHVISVPPDLYRIAACMKANATRLSPACHAALVKIGDLR